jgi:hypothetical protein
MLKTDVNNHAGNLSTLALDAHYRTGERDPVSAFTNLASKLLLHMTGAVGYFRSSIFAIIGQHFLDFARRGGKHDSSAHHPLPKMMPEPSHWDMFSVKK